MRKYIKIIFTTFIMVLILSIFIFQSYSLAKKKAEEIMLPVKDELQLVSCTLSPFYFENGEFKNNIKGLGWKVAYNTDQYFIINDIEIYVSLLGSVEMTNPRDLKDRIKSKINKN